MKILFITSKFPRFKNDPQPAFTYYLARELCRKNHEITVIAPHYHGASVEERFDGIEVHRFRYFIPTRWQKVAYDEGIPAKAGKANVKLQLPFYTLAQILMTRRLVKQGKFNIVHVHWALPQGLAALCSGLPYVCTVYGGEVALAKKFRLTWLLDHVLQKSRGNYALTTGLIQVMRQNGVTAEVEPIPLGVDTKLFRPEVRRKRKSRIVMTVCRLVEKKGTIYLLRAFKRVVEEIKDCQLVIVGSGPLENSLKQLAEQLGIGKKVTFVGEVDHRELPAYYKRADLFVLPSIIDSQGDRETQGVVFAEAMATRLAVIGTRTGGIPDVIRHMKDGVLVEQKDAPGLSRWITKLLRDDKLRKKLAQAGYSKAVRKYAWKEIAAEYDSVYRRALNRSQKSDLAMGNATQNESHTSKS